MGLNHDTRTGMGLALVLWTAAVLAGCAGGGGNEKEPIEPARVYGTREPMHVLASGIFEPLMNQFEIVFEREHPEFDLVVTLGVARAFLDADQDLQQMISDGAHVDVFLAGDVEQVRLISRSPIAVETWVGNRLVLIRRVRSKLRLIDLSRGTCEIGVALERTPLGRASRGVLESRRVWSDLMKRVGLFNDAEAIIVRTGSQGLEPMLGVVWGSTLVTRRERIESVAVLGGDEGEIGHVAAVWTERGGMFADWLKSPSAQEIVRRAGFVAARPVTHEVGKVSEPDGP